jgi:branched-subunit amino acid aminotransferase/4-amino-4-deoxychorismate lyase
VDMARRGAGGGPALPYFGVDDPARDTPCAAETSRGNLFALTPAGHWVTPPLDDNVLPGVTRRAVLDLFDAMGVPSEVAPVGVSLLRHAAGAFWTSSLSGAVVVTAVDGAAIPTAAATELADLLNDRLGFCR